MILSCSFSNKPTKTLSLGRRRYFALSLFTFVLLMGSFRATSQNTLTLAQAIKNGLENKKNILAGKLDSTISHLQTQAFYRKYGPQLSVDYTYLYNPILQTSILPIGLFNPTYPADATKSLQFGTKWTQSAGLTLILPLFDLSTHRQISEAKLQERIATLSQEQSEYELAFSIAQTYFSIYLEESKIVSLIADTNRTYISYTILNDKFSEKRLLKSDLNKSRINHNNTVQLLSDGIAQLIEDKVYLLFLMGTSEIEKWDFKTDTTLFTMYSISNTVLNLNIDSLPDIRQITLQSQLPSLQEKSERTKHLPTLNFKGFLGANQFANTFEPVAANTWFGLSYLGIELKIPLLSGENLHNKIQQLKLQFQQYELQKENKILEHKKDGLTEKVKMDNLKLRLKTQKENLDLSTESIGIFQARLAEGQESAFTLNLEEANIQILAADYDVNNKLLWTYWLNYLNSSGQLSILWK